MSLNFKLICRKCSLILVSLLLLQSVSAQYDFSEVDNLLQRNQKALGNNVVALVYKDGKEIYRKELGEYFNGKTQAPVASCSKWFTAALVMTFVDEGKLSLDDPVSKYIPVFDKYMKSYVTLRHCLTHTTGIENDKGIFRKALQRKKYQTLEEEVNAIAAMEISNNAGTEFHYGGLGLNIAGRVLEVISRKSFDRLAQERIFRPLKMRGSTFTDFSGKAVNPSGGAQSTANDYISFLNMLMNKGEWEGRRILSEKAIAEMQKPQFTELPVKYAPAVAEGAHYGLGEWIQEEDANGNSLVVSCPGLFGTWPYIDKCRNYAAVIFVKSLLNDARKDIVMQFKDAVDAQMKTGCN